jgi:hypothetical protein
MNFKYSNTNLSSENNLCRLQREGFSEIAIVPLRRSRYVSENHLQLQLRPKKRELKDSLKVRHFGGTAFSQEQSL